VLPQGSYGTIRGLHVSSIDYIYVNGRKGKGGCGGLTAVFTVRFWGWTENEREVEMDMREMVQKVKNKEPLYGVSILDAHMQGVAARNSRYSQTFFHVMPWFNFVNHNQVSFCQLRKLQGIRPLIFGN